MHLKRNMSRRNFMKSSVRSAMGVAAGLSLWGTGQSWAGANERVRVASAHLSDRRITLAQVWACLA
ncbi:MAG: twin-arginine translocation signal domain-containing protein [Planctomycetota bacterium]